MRKSASRTTELEEKQISTCVEGENFQQTDRKEKKKLWAKEKGGMGVRYADESFN